MKERRNGGSERRKGGEAVRWVKGKGCREGKEVAHWEVRNFRRK